MLQSLQGRKQRRLQVAIGLPNSRVFFGTRPLRSGADASPEGVMQKLLCSPNVTTDDLTIDMVKSSINKSPVATVTACRKKYMAAILTVLQRCGAQACRTEPAPCASGSRRGETISSATLREDAAADFLGRTEAVAVLTVDGLPMAWRCFALPSFSEGMSILSAARTLMSQSRHYEMETPLEYAIIHGRTDLHDRLQKEGLSSELGTRTVWREGPAPTPETMALGLCAGLRRSDRRGVRSLPADEAQGFVARHLSLGRTGLRVRAHRSYGTVSSAPKRAGAAGLHHRANASATETKSSPPPTPSNWKP